MLLLGGEGGGGVSTFSGTGRHRWLDKSRDVGSDPIPMTFHPDGSHLASARSLRGH